MVTIKTDLRARFSGARDQGQRPTCIAFAISDGHAAERAPYVNLSTDYLYFYGLKCMPANHGDNGISLPAATAALMADGQPLETDWPYSKVLPSALSKWSPPSGLKVMRAKIVSGPSTIDAVCSALDRGQPTILIFRSSERFHHAAADGFLPGRAKDGSLGLHAVVAAGHGVKVGTRHVLVRNSWGIGWGDQGYAWLAEDYLSPRLSSVNSLQAV